MLNCGMVTIVYNLAMLLVGTVAVGLVVRGRRPVDLLIAGGFAGTVAIVLAGGLSGGSMFDFLRLLSYGLFLCGPLLLVVSAAVLFKPARRTAVACAAAALVIVSVAVDAFWIEPYWLEVTRHTVSSPKASRPLRIVLIADLQTDRIGPYERYVLRRAIEERPDVMLLAGDYLQEYDPIAWEGLRVELNNYLHEIDFDAPLGVYAVQGNTDNRGRWPEVFEGLPVIAVRETTRFDSDDFTITALSETDSFNSRLRVEPADRFHIVLGHSPDFALGDVSADLLLAGHVHGGQVRLPGIGPLVTLSRIPRRWTSGLTGLPGGNHLLVSRGIGMERGGAPRLRFLCRPELAVIEVVPRGR